MSASRLQVERIERVAAPVAESLWRTLEVKVRPTFFLSWHWMGPWLATMEPAADLLVVRDGDEVVALGFLCSRLQARHHGLLRSMRLHLNETGDEQRDQQWIEYNGLLVAEADRAACTNRVIEALLQSDKSWDEVVIGVIPESQVGLYRGGGMLHAHELWESRSHAVSLSNLRASNQSYLATLSRNTRYQIRRSQRLYEEQGELGLERASSTVEALEMLGAASPLHIARWSAAESGFANPRFVEFHREVIRTAFDDRHIDFWRITAGDELIGFFYNLVFNGCVYFYLSALVNPLTARHKPGLLGHALLVQHYLDSGFDRYDFMGGGEAYKDSLADCGERFVRVSLQRPRAKLRLEQRLRSARQRWLAHNRLGLQT